MRLIAAYSGYCREPCLKNRPLASQEKGPPGSPGLRIARRRRLRGRSRARLARPPPAGPAVRRWRPPVRGDPPYDMRACGSPLPRWCTTAVEALGDTVPRTQCAARCWSKGSRRPWCAGSRATRGGSRPTAGGTLRGPAPRQRAPDPRCGLLLLVADFSGRLRPVAALAYCGVGLLRRWLIAAWLIAALAYCGVGLLRHWRIAAAGALKGPWPTRRARRRRLLLLIAAYDCGLLRLTAAYCGLLRLIAAYCGLLRLAAAYCGLLRLIAACCGLLRLTAHYCNLLRLGGSPRRKPPLRGPQNQQRSARALLRLIAAHCGLFERALPPRALRKRALLRLFAADCAKNASRERCCGSLRLIAPSLAAALLRLIASHCGLLQRTLPQKKPPKSKKGFRPRRAAVAVRRATRCRAAADGAPVTPRPACCACAARTFCPAFRKRVLLRLIAAVAESLLPGRPQPVADAEHPPFYRWQ